MTLHMRTLDELLTPPGADSSGLSTQEYFVNMGPQHPISHGSLRLVLRLALSRVDGGALAVSPEQAATMRELHLFHDAQREACGRADYARARAAARMG